MLQFKSCFVLDCRGFSVVAEGTEWWLKAVRIYSVDAWEPLFCWTYLGKLTDLVVLFCFAESQ